MTGHAKGTLAEQYLLRIFPNETKLILKVRHTEAGDAEHITEVRNHNSIIYIFIYYIF